MQGIVVPKLLPHRMTEDTIRQFRIAAELRNEEAWRLARGGFNAGAIYLWGYVAEMTLKAAWFSMLGYSENYAIGMKDLSTAIQMGTSVYGIAWPSSGRLHNVSCWGELLSKHRIANYGGYADATFAAQVVYHSGRVYGRWRTEMRYKKNRAYEHELRAVCQSARWLLANSDKL